MIKLYKDSIVEYDKALDLKPSSLKTMIKKGIQFMI